MKWEDHPGQSKIVTSKYISTKVVKINKIPCCVVQCQKNDEEMPVFLNDKIYLWTGTRVDELVGEDAAKFNLERKRK